MDSYEWTKALEDHAVPYYCMELHRLDICAAGDHAAQAHIAQCWKTIDTNGEKNNEILVEVLCMRREDAWLPAHAHFCLFIVEGTMCD